MSDALLEIAGLTRRFGGIVAIEDITMNVSDGEVFGLIGPNGAGKTTLLNACVACTGLTREASLSTVAT